MNLDTDDKTLNLALLTQVALGSSLGRILHDFSNPLAYMMGNLELVQQSLRADAQVADENELNPMLDDTLMGIEKMKQLLNIIRPFLFEARHEPKPTELVTLLRRICTLNTACSGRRTHLFDSVFKECQVLFDEQNLGRVLFVLLRYLAGPSSLAAKEKPIDVRLLKTEGNQVKVEICAARMKVSREAPYNDLESAALQWPPVAQVIEKEINKKGGRLLFEFSDDVARVELQLPLEHATQSAGQ